MYDLVLYFLLSHIELRISASQNGDCKTVQKKQRGSVNKQPQCVLNQKKPGYCDTAPGILWHQSQASKSNGRLPATPLSLHRFHHLTDEFSGYSQSGSQDFTFRDFRAAELCRHFAGVHNYCGMASPMPYFCCDDS